MVDSHTRYKWKTSNQTEKNIVSVKISMVKARNFVEISGPEQNFCNSWRLICTAKISWISTSVKNNWWNVLRWKSPRPVISSQKSVDRNKTRIWSVTHGGWLNTHADNRLNIYQCLGKKTENHFSFRWKFLSPRPVISSKSVDRKETQIWSENHGLWLKKYKNKRNICQSLQNCWLFS